MSTVVRTLVCRRHDTGRSRREREPSFRQTLKTRSFVAAVGALVVIAAGTGTAAAAPTGSPQSITVVAQCDSGPITLTVLGAPPSAAAWTVTTSVGVAAAVTVTDATSGEVLFQSTTPGFGENGIATTTCVVTAPGQVITIEAFFTPPDPSPARS